MTLRALLLACLLPLAAHAQQNVEPPAWDDRDFKRPAHSSNLT